MIYDLIILLSIILFCLDYIKSMASIDICRQIVSTLEKDKNSLGRLSHSNFKVNCLIKY